MKIKAIFISEETPNIDFNEIKKNNISLVFIRLGYTSYGKNKEKIKDSKFDINYKNMLKHKIKIGAYYESCAVTEEESVMEANYFLKILNEKKLSCPITVLICDKHSTLIYSDKNQFNLPKKELTNIVLKFCRIVNEDNRSIFITSYKSWFDNNLNDKEILKYDIVILPSEFNNLESSLYNPYKDNIIYLCTNKENENIEIKLEKNCILDKIKTIINVPIKYIKNKFK